MVSGAAELRKTLNVPGTSTLIEHDNFQNCLVLGQYLAHSRCFCKHGGIVGVAAFAFGGVLGGAIGFGVKVTKVEIQGKYTQSHYESIHL